MKKRMIADRVYWMGAIDWDRRLFDSLIPLPDGTSYNAYLVEGSEKTALLDAVDPAMADELLRQLDGVARVDYLISHHAEQDHSGTLPLLAKQFPGAKILASPKAKGMLLDLLDLPETAITTVTDGETLSLGDKTLKFIHTPWVHWPETMVTYLEEDRILFSCDLFGSHLATGDLFAKDQARVYEAAKRYYAEIMMPFRTIIQKNLEKIGGLDAQVIAPSHGPVYDKPEWIVEAYRQWVSGAPGNVVVVPYVSMHASVERMVKHLAASLVDRGVRVELFNLAVTDVGKLAMALVDAGTIVVGTSTVLNGPHPLALYAAYLANALKPKARFISVVGSYGWGGKTVDMLAETLAGLKAEVLEPVMVKGAPSADDLAAVDALAEAIAKKHAENGFA
ncbi:MAG: Nitric oxide reductase [Candidatus Latescibacteria bacterium ADurb.Bin168]|nr:MAG: Nitric oxide reductase [Candidatus Latescibacteria bacterium ADurb.Bin168]